MRGLFHLPGPLRRELWTHPTKVFRRRYAFKGRPEHLGKARDSAVRDTLLPIVPARTRFAPSPTGYLHLGSLRTALYNYLLAKATGGQFLLRLEDTDQSRLVHDAETRLYEDLKWAGLQWDEGPDVGGPFGPYRQSERLELYHQHASDLLSSGQGYRCFCTPEELDALKRYNMENSPNSSGHGNYNGKCSHVSDSESDRRAANGESHCIRFKSTGRPEARDLVYGRYSRPEREDDFIIIKRDRFPTYHFANVIDDHAMGITHVVRGAEWLVSTPRHVMLYDAFKWATPTFAHVGLLCNSAGQKLSKRSGDIDISSYRDKGILPVSLLNYAVLLGWSPGRGEKGTSEIMDLDEMVDKFHLRFTKGNIKISNKLPFIQSKHASRRLATLTEAEFESQHLPSMKEAINTLSSAADNDLSHLLPVLLGSSGASHEQDSRGSKLTTPLSTDTEALNTPFAHSYLLSFFALDRKSFDGDITKFVLRNQYLIWQPQASFLASTLSSSLAPISSLHLVNPAELQKSSKSEPNKALGPETVTNPASLVDKFETLIAQELPEEAWTTSPGLLEVRINALCQQIFAQSRPSADGTTPGAKLWGYHFLRWVLFAGKPGPAMIPSMQLLGRDEVLRRVRTASDIARHWRLAEDATTA
ncbi:putative glutamate--tRNA ligase [Seiridium unicorne]|uniref:glutamate--tRNA ligase n=1 Tax=Seiridium unicorne TaxID=138068 RepID=A0ABR2VAF7_9PEZI